MTAMPASNTLRRLCDAMSEAAGMYRLAAFLGGRVIAAGAHVKSPSRLILGRGATVQRGSFLHCGGKSWSGFLGHIRLGEHVVVGPHCVLYGAGGIDVGDFSHFGPGAKVMTQSGLHDAERATPRPRHRLAAVEIGEACWIGAGAVILGGSRLGRCVTVAPNAVVAGTSIPDFATVAGNPARVVRINEVPE